MRPAIALAIVLLHLLLAGLLVMRAAPRLRDAGREDRRATVRLIPFEAAPAPPEPPPAPARRRKDDLPARLAAPRPAPITPPARTPEELPSRPAAQNTISATADAATPAPAASAPAPAIVIPSQGLARSTRRHPASDDPRANRALESPGDRFARTLGTDERIVEEWRGEGRHRVRQGTSCVDVKVARDAQLDPFNQSYRPAPRLVEGCR